jgi:hypothetical protein
MACHSTHSANNNPCTCGKPEADMVGCANAKCVAGERNPDNPDCVCGSLSLKKN